MNACIEPIVGRYVHVDILGQSHRIHFEESGQGAPLLCLHAAGADARLFRHLMCDEEITRRFRVIAFDLRHQPPNSLELAMAWGPYIRACIDLSGPERCMFESDFPVDKGTCSYQVLWNAFKRIATGMSPDEKALLFSGTAGRRRECTGSNKPFLCQRPCGS